jgi:hypothetical protein
MGDDPREPRSPAAFLDVAVWGLIVAGGGFVLDVLSHAGGGGHDEGPVSLNSPGHLLMAVGVLMIAVGVGACRARLTPKLPRRVLVMLAMVSIATVGVMGSATWFLPEDGGGASSERRQGLHPPPDERLRAGSPPGRHASNDSHGVSHRVPVGVTEGRPTGAERAAAEQLLDEIERHRWRWRDRASARADGYEPTPRASGQRNQHWRNPTFMRDDRILDPRRPEGLVFRDGRLVGVVFRTPRGVEAPQPGGPLMVWHAHEPACADDPEGQACRRAPKMLHAWFSGDEAAFDTAEGRPRFD